MFIFTFILVYIKTYIHDFGKVGERDRGKNGSLTENIGSNIDTITL